MKIHDGGRPPCWKSKLRNNSIGRGSSDFSPNFVRRRIEIGVNLIFFSQKLWKYENPRWRTAAILKIDNAVHKCTSAQVRINGSSPNFASRRRPDYVQYVTWRRAGLSASAELLVTWSSVIQCLTPDLGRLSPRLAVKQSWSAWQWIVNRERNRNPTLTLTTG